MNKSTCFVSFANRRKGFLSTLACVCECVLCNPTLITDSVCSVYEQSDSSRSARLSISHLGAVDGVRLRHSLRHFSYIFAEHMSLSMNRIAVQLHRLLHVFDSPEYVDSVDFVFLSSQLGHVEYYFFMRRKPEVYFSKVISFYFPWSRIVSLGR